MGGLWWVGRSGRGFGGARRGIVVGALAFVYFGAVLVKTLRAGVYARGERWAFVMRMFNMSKSMFEREVRASEVHGTIGLQWCFLHLHTHKRSVCNKKNHIQCENYSRKD